MLRKLRFFLIIRNEDITGKFGYMQIPKYRETLIKLFHWRQLAIVNPIHAIDEFKLLPTFITKYQRLLIGEKIFSFIHIII